MLFIGRYSVLCNKFNGNAWYIIDNFVNSCYFPGIIRGESILYEGWKFPNGHVSGNKTLRQKGIGCAQSQDREAQKKPRFSIDELEKALNDSMN